MAVVVRTRARSSMALRKHQECLRFTAVLLLLAITSEAARPTGNQAVGVGLEEGNTASVKQYLNRFGYLDMNKFDLNDVNSDGHDLESALKNFQITYNLKPTGVVDEQTKQLMMKPRCGNTDIGMDLHNPSIGPRSQHRILEEFHYKYPASKRNLTYWIDSRKTGGIPFEVVSSLYSSITSAWSKVSHFTFKEVNDIADIWTAIYSKGDPVHALECGDDPFTRPGEALGHARCYPSDYSFIHVNAEVQWATVAPATSTQYDLENSLLHEMGHALGLLHSSDPKAIMYAYAFHGDKKLQITDTDVNMLKALYGADF